MEKVTFSIVIPVYNAEKVINRALLSIKKQTFKDYQIIIVNDGSTDKTKAAVEDFFKENNGFEYKYINVKRNRGVAYARNVGLKESQATYVAFLDADDIWYPEKLEMVHKIINKSKEIDLICHNLFVKRQGVIAGKLITCKNNKIDDLFKVLLFRQNYIYTSATVVKKESILKIGQFSENLFSGEDYDCWLRMSLRDDFKFYFLEEFLGEYSISSNSILSNFKTTSNQLRAIVRSHYFNNYKIHSLMNRLLLYLRENKILYDASINAYYRGRLNLSIELMLKCLARNPFMIKGYIWLSIYLFNLSFSSVLRQRVF